MAGLKLVLLIVAAIAATLATPNGNRATPEHTFPTSKLVLRLLQNGATVQYTINRGNEVLHTAKLDAAFNNVNVNKTSTGFILSGTNNRRVEFRVLEDSTDFSLLAIRRNLTRGSSSRDCVSLDIGRLNWYGGPENRYQYWPIEKASFTNYSYITKETDNCAITEPYWLSSNGVFVYVDAKTPLFIDQNSNSSPNQLCLIGQKVLPFNVDENDFAFNYNIGIAKNSREAHLRAVKHFLKKPTGIADERMVRHPIWSTWAAYKAPINESVVVDFGNQILRHNFNNSQLEIDDDWEDCYGALTFRKSKFPDIKRLTDSLKQKGFRVTLWIHPFINKNCEPWYSQAKSMGYLVLDHNGNADTKWWNSNTNQSSYIDFTKPAAAKWFSDRLKKLQVEAGIDSFKFDAGETSWSPPNPVLTGSKELSPSLITMEYIRTVAAFGPIVEVRSGQNTQDLPIFMRMIDKDSEWSWNNGLPTLITTLLQTNLAGYPFVLPDMIGGNGYNGAPDKELFIRWLQANVFMPSLQFSYVPWDYDSETIAISQAMTKLHDQYTNLIMERFALASKNGDPVNPPLWWVDPEDVVARQIWDQFLLGEQIIAAPVIGNNQRERDIYLPKGTWRDGNRGTVHVGPKWLMSYQVPLSMIPYFVKA